MEIAAEFAEFQRLVVNHGGAAIQFHDVFARGLRIHGHQEIDFLAAADVAVLAGANGKPGGQPGDIRREHVLARNRNAHLENGAHQDGVGSLAARSVHCSDLDAEIVDDRMARLAGRDSAGDTSSVDIDKESFCGKILPSSLASLQLYAISVTGYITPELPPGFGPRLRGAPIRPERQITHPTIPIFPMQKLSGVPLAVDFGDAVADFPGCPPESPGVRELCSLSPQYNVHGPGYPAIRPAVYWHWRIHDDCAFAVVRYGGFCDVDERGRAE